MHEIETKVLDIDAVEVEKKLKELGAKEVQRTRLSVDWFRLKNIKEGEDEWYLRIRTNSAGSSEVTWKGKSDVLGAARKHKEINFLIADPAGMSDLFESIGLEKYAHQEKDRISWTLNNWRFDLDHYPKMPAYMEIESDSEESIQEALKLLNLEGHKTSSEGERLLIQKQYGLDWYNMRF